MNEFEDVKSELDEMECSDHIPLPTSYVKKWRILLRTKVFQCCLRYLTDSLSLLPLFITQRANSLLGERIRHKVCGIYVFFNAIFQCSFGMVCDSIESLGFYQSMCFFLVFDGIS